jgi:hypothetical protein
VIMLVRRRGTEGGDLSIDSAVKYTVPQATWVWRSAWATVGLTVTPTTGEVAPAQVEFVVNTASYWRVTGDLGRRTSSLPRQQQNGDAPAPRMRDAGPLVCGSFDGRYYLSRITHIGRRTLERTRSLHSQGC